MARESEHVVDGIVIEAADAGRARTSGFGFQIQHLADYAALPEQPTIEPLAAAPERLLDTGDHGEAEESVLRDLLVARHAIGRTPDVERDQEKQSRIV